MYYEAFPFVTDGIVKDTNDPLQNGRLKIWCPALDGEEYDIDTLPWAEYCTPFGGVTNDFNAGRNKNQTMGPVSYGFWGLPKVGAQVYVFLLNGDNTRRVYFGSNFGLHRNRSLPHGRNKSENNAPGPFSDSYDPLQPAYANTRIAFEGKMGTPQAKSRGWYQRQAAQDKTEKDGTEGYAKNTVDGQNFDPQTYCFVTPGHHMIVLDDTPENCQVRIRTCEGAQFLIDDTNERIYISTAKGNNWVEMDEDGHISFFGSDSYSVRSGKDINFFADGDFNAQAAGNINFKAVNGGIKMESTADFHLRSASGSIYQTACDEFHVCVTNGMFISANEINESADTSIFVTANGGNVNLKGSSGVILGAGGSMMNLNGSDMKIKSSNIELDAGGSLVFGASSINTKTNGGGSASYKPFGKATPPNDAQGSTCATSAGDPSVVPGHEPWERPASSKQRNKNWSK